jgi:hypothetical protein
MYVSRCPNQLCVCIPDVKRTTRHHPLYPCKKKNGQGYVCVYVCMYVCVCMCITTHLHSRLGVPQQSPQPVMGTLQFSVFASPGVGIFGLGSVGVVVVDDASVRGVGVVAPVFFCLCVCCVCVCEGYDDMDRKDACHTKLSSTHTHTHTRTHIHTQTYRVQSRAYFEYSSPSNKEGKCGS